jgi:single-strand DNA-binding protein
MEHSTTTSVTGLVATTPRHLETREGILITSFRLASNERVFDRTKGIWKDGNTNWFTITLFGTLALNAKNSINKGDRVLVTGSIRVRDWDNGDRTGTSVEIEGTAVGHDLTWGTTTFTRSVHASKSTIPADSIDLTAEL